MVQRKFLKMVTNISI